MKKPQFKGYILEEILAYLIRTSGYKLITKAPSNDPDLNNKSNGLNLKGRGANHQIDVLGELNWIPAFNFPLRLMVEAKFCSKPTDIGVVREQVGILADVNQNYFVIKNTEPKPRYRYTSVIFSTSGFSEHAIDMAVAHQIQLADLSDEEYSGLREKITEFANNIFNNLEEIKKSIFHDIKKYVRNQLSIETNNIEINNSYKNACNKLINFVKNDYKELFIGMNQGGFMLLLKAENPEKFIEYAIKNSTHNIKINWKSIDNGKKWNIVPVDQESYKLTFKLPQKLHDWIFKTSKNKFDEAISQKEKHFSKISIYYHNNSEGRDYVFNLKFNKKYLTGNND
ncbi:hypothetical protein KAI65_06400 [Candidatus Parcubacteria bacterium]|nr:hypothetical protein [Candidatus Parcubacteria bacterium]